MCNQNSIDIEELWDLLDKEALEKQFSQEAILRLIKEYAHWDTATQEHARSRFGKWLSSENSRKRFDALAMIDDLSALETTNDLLQHRDRLSRASGPAARFELKQVERILKRFEDEGGT